MTNKDYIYCKDCRMFVDLWKYDSIDDTGHADCNWRYVTTAERKESEEECRENGCFEEVI